MYSKKLQLFHKQRRTISHINQYILSNEITQTQRNCCTINNYLFGSKTDALKIQGGGALFLTRSGKFVQPRTVPKRNL